jgi:hypothetical protein
LWFAGQADEVGQNPLAKFRADKPQNNPKNYPLTPPPKKKRRKKHHSNILKYTINLKIILKNTPPKKENIIPTYSNIR